MSDNLSEKTTTSESVSLKVIVPSVTVVALLVLITIVGAVIIIVRAYRKRQLRRGLRLSKTDAEATIGSSDGGMWRDGDGWENHVRNGRLTRDSRQIMSRYQNFRKSDPVRLPEPAAFREPRPFSWDAREIVGKGFQRGRSRDGVDKAVTVGFGYRVNEPVDDLKRKSVHVAEIALGVAPLTHSRSNSISKIERITGNSLSNDLYEDRTSGTGADPRRNRQQPGVREAKGLSYPPINTKVAPVNKTSAPELQLDTEILSPTDTEIRELEMDFSPISRVSTRASTIINPLAPPPAARIIQNYPNIATLAEENTTGAVETYHSSIKSYRKLSYPNSRNITEHIASQYNPTKQQRMRSGGPAPSRNASTRSLVPPPSASFGKFPRYEARESRANRPSRTASSASTTLRGQPVEEHPTVPSSHRRSWSGRSILLLDDVVNDQPTEARPTTAPDVLSPLSPSFDDQVPDSPRFAKARTSALGRASQRERLLAALPIPPDPPESDYPLRLTRSRSGSASTSKASIISLPSSISSFNTVTHGCMPTVSGLSPTPAPRGRSARDSDASDKRKSSATAKTDVSEAPSNMTAHELEMEMKRIRDRAKRVSAERKRRRRQEEQDRFDTSAQQDPSTTGFGYI